MTDYYFVIESIHVFILLTMLFIKLFWYIERVVSSFKKWNYYKFRAYAFVSNLTILWWGIKVRGEGGKGGSKLWGHYNKRLIAQRTFHKSWTRLSWKERGVGLMNRATVRLGGDKTQKWERKGIKKKWSFPLGICTVVRLFFKVFIRTGTKVYNYASES